VQVLDSAPNTYRGSRSLARWLANGEASPPRPRSSSVPSYRPPHDDDLEGPLSPGSGEGQSRKVESVRRGRGRERPIKRIGLPDRRAQDRSESLRVFRRLDQLSPTSVVGLSVFL
jgi:hypothetical protein